MSLNKSIYITAAILALSFRTSLCSSPLPDNCQRAFDDCHFTFIDAGRDVPGFRLRPQDQAITSRVVSKNRDEFLGVLNTNGIIPEFVQPDGRGIEIINFGMPHFTPTHFKPFFIPRSGSGVGHQTFIGNQLSVARGKCVRIFFTEYQLLRSFDGDVIRNRNGVPRSENSCVVFLTF